MKAYDLSRLNVLVVEDNQHMASLLKDILRAFQIRNVKVSPDGGEALRELRVFPADVAITDWMMEPIDGIDFVHFVRTASDSPNPFLPIVMLTGHTELGRVTEARDAGIDEFLAKPITANALYHRIIRVIDHRRTYVRGGHYFGPDRRRRDDPHYSGPERRKSEG